MAKSNKAEERDRSTNVGCTRPLQELRPLHKTIPKPELRSKGSKANASSNTGALE